MTMPTKIMALFSLLAWLLLYSTPIYAQTPEAEQEPSTSDLAAAEEATTQVSTSPTPAQANESEDEEIEVVDDVEDVTQQPPLYSSEAWADKTAFPAIERGVNLATARTTKRNAVLIVIDHRTNQAFTKNTWRDYFGLDAGKLKIGIGVRYGILDNLDMGIYRLGGAHEIFDAYELDLRYRFLSQQDYHLDMAVRAGVTWFYQPDRDDAVGGFGQLMLSREFFNRLLLSASALFHSESSYQTKKSTDDEWSFAVGGLVEIRLIKWLAWNLEVIGGVAGYHEEYPNFSSALKFITSMHTFSLVLSNTQYLNADGIVSGSHRDWDNLVVGFQITREITF